MASMAAMLLPSLIGPLMQQLIPQQSKVVQRNPDGSIAGTQEQTTGGIGGLLKGFLGGKVSKKKGSKVLHGRYKKGVKFSPKQKAELLARLGKHAGKKIKHGGLTNETDRARFSNRQSLAVPGGSQNKIMKVLPTHKVYGTTYNYPNTNETSALF